MQRGTGPVIFHGVLLGFVAGCIVSCCDAFFIV